MMIMNLASASLPDSLPRSAFEIAPQRATLVANSAFAPSATAAPGPTLSGVLSIGSALLVTTPVLETGTIQGRDVRRFPAIRLTLYTLGDRLVPVERGTLVNEIASQGMPSYWSVIPESGRVWTEAADEGWHRAALPITLVNDTENAAHQGLLTFLYRDGAVSAVRLQFVQQTGPYLVKPHMAAAALAPARFTPMAIPAEDANAAAREWAARLPVRPLSELAESVGPGALDGLGGPLLPQWQVLVALLHDDTLWSAGAETVAGPFPYPEGMRFGVRSVMKSVAAPLALLHLAEVYGPWVIDLPIGRYVSGLDPKYDHIRFVDAANMATGFGGTGTLRTNPNDLYDGYLGGDYDAWYLAPSHAEKIAEIRRTLSPYPWEPGRVVRYRDQDYYLLGVALDHFLKSIRGNDADLWDMLAKEVFAPIGIARAPAIRTRETTGRGVIWANAGYYPTLDDVAKIARLYQRRGECNGQQLLHRGLVTDLLGGIGALEKNGDATRQVTTRPTGPSYGFGFHYLPYRASTDSADLLVPSMQGSGENEVILAPNGWTSLRFANASGLPEGTAVFEGDPAATLRVLDAMEPFSQ
jgi:hypothetical protein